MSHQQEVSIVCEDECTLAGTLYLPEDENSIKAAIMIAPATGIKRQFYRSFASFLAENGYAVITFDNRGIGDSLVGKLKHCDASIKDWGYLDMPAVLEFLKTRFAHTTYHLIGHSAGGQLPGLMHNHQDISSIFNVACSSGQLDNMRAAYRRQAKFFMNVFMPFSNFFWGYTNTQWIGMGEPLPKKVAQDWSYWCHGAGYVETAFGKSITQHWYDEISCPSLWINASDDDIANDKNVDDMTRVFTQLPVKRLKLNPIDCDLDEIGHMKFFSRKSKTLWTIATDWLNQNTQ